jgi:NAD(P)H-dependent FMN reductase
LNLGSCSNLDGVTDVISDETELSYAVIAASVRKDRVSRAVADWVARTALARRPVDQIDLADCPLPPDELLSPRARGRTEIAGRLDAADAFVVVTPEYNHSYPAALKRAIDWHYDEWAFKAVTVIPYGVQGGLLAAEHLRGVFAELSVVTTRRVVGIRDPHGYLGPTGFDPPTGLATAVRAAIDELDWWAATLRRARHERPFRG